MMYLRLLPLNKSDHVKTNVQSSAGNQTEYRPCPPQRKLRGGESTFSKEPKPRPK